MLWYWGGGGETMCHGGGGGGCMCCVVGFMCSTFILLSLPYPLTFSLPQSFLFFDFVMIVFRRMMCTGE